MSTTEMIDRIVRPLSNMAYVRWWGHWNYPQEPRQIAFRAIDFDGSEFPVQEDISQLGFEIIEREGMIFYVSTVIK